MTVEEFFKQCNSKELDKFDKKASKFTYYDLLEFAEQYHRKQLQLGVVSITEGKLPLWTNNDIDAAYVMGYLNVSGIDAIHKELERLKELGLKPHEAVSKVRGKSGN